MHFLFKAPVIYVWKNISSEIIVDQFCDSKQYIDNKIAEELKPFLKQVVIYGSLFCFVLFPCSTIGNFAASSWSMIVYYESVKNLKELNPEIEERYENSKTGTSLVVSG